MKKIFTIILLCGIALTSHASTLAPSLETQMQKQEIINKQKTALEKKLAIQERKRQNAQKIATLRAKKQSVAARKNTVVTTVISSSKTATTQTKATTSNENKAYTTTSNTVTQTTVPNVDMTRVRTTWLSWYNTGRAAKGLGAYSYDSCLDDTAHDWNIVFAESRGTNFHERNPGDGYYNYNVINKWFQDRGVNPPVVGGVNHSENVSYGYYTCSKTDCTDDFINSIRSSYTFFINSAVHSKSVYQPNFTKIGFDVIVIPSEKRYYITVHYITK